MVRFPVIQGLWVQASPSPVFFPNFQLFYFSVEFQFSCANWFSGFLISGHPEKSDTFSQLFVRSDKPYCCNPMSSYLFNNHNCHYKITLPDTINCYLNDECRKNDIPFEATFILYTTSGEVLMTVPSFKSDVHQVSPTVLWLSNNSTNWFNILLLSWNF